MAMPARGCLKNDVIASLQNKQKIPPPKIVSIIIGKKPFPPASSVILWRNPFFAATKAKPRSCLEVVRGVRAQVFFVCLFVFLQRALFYFPINS